MTVDHFVDDPQINFPNQIVPIFTKLGCNSGGCHGKASGQNGFKLSLLGFEPGEDYEHLVKEARGRRLFPAAPDRSLLLTKPINAIPHGGGQRLDRDSLEYRLLKRWISQGMPYGKDTDPKVASIEVSARATLAIAAGRATDRRAGALHRRHRSKTSRGWHSSTQRRARWPRFRRTAWSRRST